MNPRRARRPTWAALWVLLACNTDGAATSPATAPPARADAAPSWVHVAWRCEPDACEGDRTAIEAVVSRVAGTTTIRSRIAAGTARVSLAFASDDPSASTMAVRDAVTEAQRSMTAGVLVDVEGVPRGLVAKRLTVSGGTSEALADAARTLASRLRMVPGVRRATPCLPSRRVVLEVDPQRCAAFGMDPARMVELVREPFDAAGFAGAPSEAIDPAAIFARFGSSDPAGMLRRVDETELACATLDATGRTVTIDLRFTDDHTRDVDAALAADREVLAAGGVTLHDEVVRRDVVELRISGLDDARLRTAAERLRGLVPAAVSAVEIEAGPQLRITPDRERAASFGISVADILGAVRLRSREGESLGVLADPDRTPVVARIGGAEGEDALEDATVRAQGGALVPLDALVTFETTAAPPSPEHCDRRPCVVLELDAAAASAIDLAAVARSLALGDGESLTTGAAPPLP